MYQIHCSIRRHALGCAGLLCLLLLVSSTTRCNSDSITGGESAAPDNPTPGDPGPIGTPIGVGRVTISPSTLTLNLNETARLNAIVRDTQGTVIADPQVVFTVLGSRDGAVAVDSTGLVTGLTGGVGTVTAESQGVKSNIAVITVLSEVGSVTLVPESLTIGVGETAQLSVIVRDRTGAVMANPQMVFLQSDLPVGTVDSTGLVTGLPPGDDCGFGTVIARTGGLDSNPVKVVIRDFSQSEVGGCWDY